MQKSSFSILECCDFKELPSHSLLYSLLDKVTTILENEITDFRPSDCQKNPGSLVLLENSNPTVLVPDIHARPFFIKNILNFTLPKRFFPSTQTKESVLNLLEQDKINMVCVGDAFHTEGTRARWQKIQNEFINNQFDGPAMKEEMTECLSSFCALLNLKIAFPNNFHFLKGNHENILNINSDGDCAFLKYADEGNMVKTFIANYYGEDILFLISLYEKLLPLVAKTKKCVVSHAEPSLCLTKDDIIDARQNPNYVYSLIWTKNDQVKQDTAQFIINSLFTSPNRKKSVKDILYFTGHRPVKQIYELRQEGKIVQFHNTNEQRIAVVSANKKFNLEKDFFNVN